MVNVTRTPEGNLATWIDGEEVIYNLGDCAWVVTATVIVSIMPIGLGLLYAGLLRRKNALSMIFLAVATYTLGLLQWFFWGYSLTYSGGANAFIGDLQHGGLVGVDIQPSPGSTAIPALLYSIYQGQFSSIAACVMIAGSAERGRMGPFLILVFCWLTIIYCPVACWVWNGAGWLYNAGELDWAGGGPVHITSGISSFVISWSQSSYMVVLGTAFLFYGWCGFNGASMSALNLKSFICVTNTFIAGAAGAFGWFAVDFFYTRRYSAVGMASGILGGLIGITPAVGYVGVPAAFGVGFLTAIVCNFATALKRFVKVDDAVDAFALHACGGFFGAILTGFFADSRVASFDGLTEIEGGWINHNYKQMGWQLAGSLSIIVYTAVVTYILLFLINLIPGCKFRSSEEAEIVGIDEAEFAYDYLELRKDIEADSAHDFPAVMTSSTTDERGRAETRSHSGGSKDPVATGKVEAASAA
ncbi:hypothetical protein Rhopal_003148-T1 [Rhodotorula paludigena]|uniref:Ammonium transporter AmtB-like domain-containing protein n=1 Tax=Rhodotorula paludigena TaxID=86838 RepID=A0AAV5GJR6_9BASI|nr:hypothetical protein Rhopal_003148-T1 [Rhodotorula paludigena]